MTHSMKIERLMTTREPFLTDGGFETSMLFHEGFDLPLFAACVLMDNDDARVAMTRYFDRYLCLAARARTGFVLDTNTWRAGLHWGAGLGLDDAEMLRLNRAAVDFANDLRTKWENDADLGPVLINGVIGPAGDAYAPGTAFDAATARMMHLPQVRVLAEAGVDMISALTFTQAQEAAGLAQAAAEQGVPVVISFTVETDGRLPGGQTLGEAIAETDAATDNAPLYYMVNCAHPDHFGGVLASDADWVRRIGGVRANASRLSHAELDEAEVLDDGNPEEFGRLHGALAALLPNLRVIGGCCGTDHRHVGCVSGHLHSAAA